MRRLLLVLGLLPALACVPDFGPHPYDGEEIIVRDAGSALPLPGPDPYQPGEERLSLGIFYEGGYSETFVVDNVSSHFYTYLEEASQQPTVAVESSGERVEGSASDAFRLTGKPWWGAGVHWDVERDLSAWTTLQISLRSADPAFADLEFGMTGGAEIRVNASDYGYTNDDTWHHLIVPLSDLTAGGVELARITVPLQFIGAAGSTGETLLVDAVYLTAD